MNRKAKLSVTIALVLFVLSFGYILIQNISADPVITADSTEPLSSFVLRTMPSYYSPDTPLIVNLTMTLTKDSCGVAYIEHIPVGWIPKDLPKDGAPLYNDKLSTITYAPIDGPFCQGNAIHDLSYTIVPSTDAKGIQVFYSEFSVDGKSYPTDKNTITDKQTASLDSSNQKTYDLATQEVTITNPTIDITPVEVAKAKLNTPIHNLVPVGDDVKFAQINLSLLIDYPSFFKSIQFIDLKTNQTILRPIRYKIPVQFKQEVNDTNITCQQVPDKVNNNGTYEECTTSINGTKTELFTDWKEIDLNNMPSKDYTIGLFTDVREGDHVEWIANMAGQDITEWADFEAYTLLYRSDTGAGANPAAHKGQWNCQNFTVNIANTTLAGVSVLIYRVGITFAGNFSIRTPDVNNMPGTIIALNDTYPPTTILTNANWTNVTFDRTPLLVNGSTYYLCISTNISSGTDYLRWKVNTTANVNVNYATNPAGILMQSVNDGATWGYAGAGQTGMYRIYGTLAGSGDSIYPTFSNEVKTPNATTYASGKTYDFDISVLNTNGSVYMEFGGANYSLSNNSISNYTKTFTDLKAGVYSYYYWGYGNGTSNNFNRTRTFSYTVVKASSSVKTYLGGVEGDSSVLLGHDIFLNGTLVSGKIVSLNMTADGIQVNYTTNGDVTYTYHATGLPRTVIINVSYPGNENYTQSSENWNLALNDHLPIFSNLRVSPASPTNYSLIQPYIFNVTISDNDNDIAYVWLNMNGTNYTATSLGSGIYNYTFTGLKAGNLSYQWFANDSTSLANSSGISSMFINKSQSQVSLIFDKASPQSSGVQLNASCSVISGVGTPVLYSNGVDVTATQNSKLTTLTAGNYIYNCSLASNENYTESENVSTYVIYAQSTIIPNPTNPANGISLSSASVSFGYNLTTTSGTLDSIFVFWNTTNANVSIYDKSLLSWYQFNNFSVLGENSTYVPNLVDGKNNLTASSNLTYISNFGRNGNGGFYFTENTTPDGVRELTSPTQVLTNRSENFTISVWIKPYSYHYSDTAMILQAVSNYGLVLKWSKNSQRCFFGNYNGTTDSDSTYFNQDMEVSLSQLNDCPIDQWTNFVVTRENPNNMSLYINGQLLYRGRYRYAPATGEKLFGANTITEVGADNGYGQLSYLSFNGSIDDLMIYNRTLLGNEVNQLYRMQLTKYNSTDYSLSLNESLSSYTNYTYNIFMNDTIGNANSTKIYSIFGLPITSSAYADFTKSLSTINPWFYGVNTHGCWFSGCANIRLNNGSTQPENFTLHNQLRQNANLNYLRNDMSLTNFYGGQANFGFEDTWKNTSYSFSYNNHGSTALEMTRGWTVAFGYGNGSTYQQTNGCHGGNRCWTYNTTTGYIYTVRNLPTDTLALTFNNATLYNVSIWAIGQGTFSIVLYDATNGYTYNCSAGVTKTLTGSWVQYSSLCQTNNTDGHNYRFTLDTIKANVTFDDFNITYYNGSAYPQWWRTDTGNMTRYINDYNYNHANGIRTLMIEDYMVGFLANTTSGCNWTGTYTISRCAPTDYDTYASLAVDFYDRMTGCTTQSCRNAVDDIDNEVWNEPYGSFLLDYGCNGSNECPNAVSSLPFDSKTKADVYTKIYNASYFKLRQYYPNISIGGPSGYIYGNVSYYVGSSNLFNIFLSNKSYYGYNLDFISQHPYKDNYASLSQNFMQEVYSNLLALESTYSIPRSIRVVNSEWSDNNNYINTSSLISSDSLVTNQTTFRIMEMRNGFAYFDLLGNFSNITSNAIYQWSSGYNITYTPYTDNGLHYDMFDEVDNFSYPIYTITANLSKVFPANGSVYFSNSSDTGIRVLAGMTTTGNQTIGIINTYSDYRLVSLSILNATNTTLIDNNGSIYSSTSVITMEPYDVRFFTIAPAQTNGDVNPVFQNLNFFNSAPVDSTNLSSDTIHGKELCSDIKSFFTQKALTGLAVSDIGASEIMAQTAVLADKYQIDPKVVNDYFVHYQTKCGPLPNPALEWLKRYWIALLSIIITVIILAMIIKKRR